MANAKMTVSPERWKEMNENDRTWIIYDSLITIDKRVTHLEHDAWMHKGFAFVGGVIGGGLSFLGIKWGGLG